MIAAAAAWKLLANLVAPWQPVGLTWVSRERVNRKLRQQLQLPIVIWSWPKAFPCAQPVGRWCSSSSQQQQQLLRSSSFRAAEVQGCQDPYWMSSPACSCSFMGHESNPLAWVGPGQTDPAWEQTNFCINP